MDLRSIAPNTVRLKDQIAQQAAGATGERAQQYRALSDTLKDATDWNSLAGNVGAIRALEANLGSDPAFRRNVTELATNNPGALNRIIPQVLRNPDGMKQLVATTAAATRPAAPAPAATAAAPRAPATPEPAASARSPDIRSQRDTSAPRQRAASGEARPAPVEAAATAVGAGAQAEAAPQNVAAAPANNMLEKIERLTQIEGYAELMQRVEGNPRLKDMFDSMMNGGGDDPAAAERTLDGILAQAEQNPNIFKDLVKTIDEKPGVVSSIAETMANDPRNGMMMIGMYSQFQQGLGKSLDGLFGPGALDGLIQGLIGMIGQFFGKSGGLMSMGNNGGDLLRQFGSIVGNTPPVTTIDADSGVASDPARPGTQTPVQLAQQREAELRRTGQTQQPGMNAPAPSGAG